MNNAAILDCVKQALPDLPDSHFLDAEQASALYGANTLKDAEPVSASVKVLTRDHVKRLLALAVKHNFCLCPLSTGNNWGYGSVNPADGRPLVVLDMQCLTGIHIIDAEKGLVAVEPGVTQQRLADFLQQHDMCYMVPTTGAGPDCGILSNALERGYGINSETNHFLAVTEMRTLVPALCCTEKLTCPEVSSAIQALDKSCESDEQRSYVANCYKWGLGPYLDGLFTQSNLGIVVEATIALAPKAQSFRSFYINFKHAGDLAKAVTFIQRTLSAYEGKVVPAINLMDKRRVVSMALSREVNGLGADALTDEEIETFAALYDISEWTIAGSIHATDNAMPGIVRDIRQYADGAAKIIFSDAPIVRLGKWLLAQLALPSEAQGFLIRWLFAPHVFGKYLSEKYWLGKRIKQLKLMNLGIDIMQGRPNRVAMPLAYGRHPDITPDIRESVNPDHDGCGLGWYAPIVPFSIEKIEEFVDFVRKTTPQYDIEPLITFTFLKSHFMDSTVPIVFHRENADAAEKARQCMDTLFEDGQSKGFVPYRMAAYQQQKYLSSSSPYWQVVGLLKQALDPGNVINPTRYCPK